jgi:hypothetical protein
VVSAWGIAALHSSLGDVDEAFRWLGVAVEERATSRYRIAQDAWP